MPVGMQVLNDDNVFQIDGVTPVLSLTQKGYAPLVQGNYARISEGTFSFTGTNPIPAIKVNGSYSLAGIGNFTKNGNTYTATVLLLRDSTLAFTGSVEYYIFDNPSFSNNNAGLQVFSETGTCIFDSNVPIMQVVRPISADQLPPGKQYAFWSMAGYDRTLDVEVDTRGDYFYREEIRFAGLRVLGSSYIHDNFPVYASSGTGTSGGNTGWIGPSYTFFPTYFVDVTNL